MSHFPAHATAQSWADVPIHHHSNEASAQVAQAAALPIQAQGATNEPRSAPQTVDEILEHMTDYSPWPDVQARACKSLLQITASQGGQDLAMSKIGVEPITKVM